MSMGALGSRLAGRLAIVLPAVLGCAIAPAQQATYPVRSITPEAALKAARAAFRAASGVMERTG